MGSGRRLLLVGVLASIAPGRAHADEAWLVSADAPGAIPLSSPQSAWFGVGGLPSVALYRSLSPWLLVGARLRGGVLADGDAPREMGYADPGTGGLGTLGLSARLRPLGDRDDPARGTGPWLELAGGGALTGGGDAGVMRPAFELGIGWTFAVGAVDLGPSLRYLHIVQPEGGLSGADARLALIGVELHLFDGRRRRPLAEVVVARPAAEPTAPPPTDRDGDGILDGADRCVTEPEDPDGFEDTDGCPDLDDDGDQIVDTADACPREPEVMNGVDDTDGCPDQGLFQVVEDRIVLEERVLFDSARARVKRDGKKILAAIVAFRQAHPEYERMTIEGHSDPRGPEDYNLWLSRERATRVMHALIELGLPADALAVEAFGETRPLATGEGAEAMEKNRRVEFVLIRGPSPAPTPTPTPAPSPAPTDGAP